MSRHIVLFAMTTCLLFGCSEGGVGGTGGTVIPASSTSVVSSGVANKGPFVSNSLVEVFALSDSGVRGDLIATSSVQNLGDFQVNIEQSGNGLIEVTGSYFSENSGSTSSASINLAAVVVLERTINVNLASHLIAPRVLQLMADGNERDVAAAMARDELLLALAPVLNAPTSIIEFTELTLINANTDAPDLEGNAWLLALSTIFDAVSQTNAEPAAALQVLVDEIAADLAVDGVLDSDRLAPLAAARASVDPVAVRMSLLELAESLLQDELVALGAPTNDAGETDCRIENSAVSCTSASAGANPSEDVAATELPVGSVIADINLFLDTDGDGSANAEDADDDNDGLPDAEDPFPYDPG